MSGRLRLLDPRNGRAWDLPPAEGPARTWVVASLPRTGSTLLCRALWGTGRVGAPAEYLNPTQLRDWEVRDGSLGSRLRHLPLRGPLLGLVGRGPWPEERLRAHLERVRARRSGRSGWFGLKLHHHHFVRWFPDGDLERFLGPSRWVLVTRDDHLAQAVSWARALQTGRWSADERGWRGPRFDRALVADRLARIARHEAAWRRFFAERGLEPLHLTYESLAADLPGAARAVLRHLGEPDDAPIPDPGLRRQADALSARWTARFRAR